MKRMTYNQGTEIIIAIFAATSKGHERDAHIKCTHKIDDWMESGAISYRTGDRLKNFLFDYTALVQC